MGAFYLIRRGAAGLAPGLESSIRESLTRQGFADGQMLETRHAAIGVYRKLHAPADNVHREADGAFCAAVGTLLYRNQTGVPALRALLADFRGAGIRYRDLFGSYCVLLHDGVSLRMFTDPIGTYHVFRDSAETAFSNSFVALAAGAKRLTVNTQAVYEYVFQGATYGGATVFDEIQLVPSARQWTIGERIEPSPNDAGDVPDAADDDIDAHLARNLANLRRYYESIAACFGDRVDTALSGGYDSRLTLALLLEQGRMPKIHVYGDDDDDDVRVAKTIAAAEGFALEHKNKRRADPLDGDAFADQVARNFHGFNGYPDDGIFDNGTDLAARAERCRDGELMLNGGGGEVFRNFFYLPDRRFSVRQVLWSFYGQFDPRECGSLFSERDYLRQLGDKMAATVGVTSSEILTQLQVERVYPHFRCRFWMGRNNSVNNRIGPALTPFIDINVVPAALALPLTLKSFGRFEARMIHAINPRLAGYMSSYGHSFAEEPPLKRRLKELAVYARPPALRRLTYRLKSRRPGPRPYWLSDDYLDRVIDRSFPYMRAFFDPERLYLNQRFNRLCTLEYMFERLQPALADGA